MATLLSLTVCISAKPYIPADESRVLFEVKQSSQLRALQALRQQLRQQPANLVLLQDIIERYVRLARQQADERYFSYAESLLTPYLDSIQGKPELLLLWADILQRRIISQGQLSDIFRTAIPGRERSCQSVSGVRGRADATA